MSNPYREQGRARLAPSAPFLRVARSWVTGRLIRYGRKRSVAERITDLLFLIGLIHSAIVIPIGVLVFVHSGQLFLIVAGTIIAIINILTGIARRTECSRKNPSARARGVRPLRNDNYWLYVLGTCTICFTIGSLFAHAASRGPDPKIGAQSVAMFIVFSVMATSSAIGFAVSVIAAIRERSEMR